MEMELGDFEAGHLVTDVKSGSKGMVRYCPERGRLEVKFADHCEDLEILLKEQRLVHASRHYGDLEEYEMFREKVEDYIGELAMVGYQDVDEVMDKVVEKFPEMESLRYILERWVLNAGRYSRIAQRVVLQAKAKKYTRMTQPLQLQQSFNGKPTTFVISPVYDAAAEKVYAYKVSSIEGVWMFDMANGDGKLKYQADLGDMLHLHIMTFPALVIAATVKKVGVAAGESSPGYGEAMPYGEFFEGDRPFGKKKRVVRDQPGGYKYDQEEGDPGIDIAMPDGGNIAQSPGRLKDTSISLGLPDSRTVPYNSWKRGEPRASQTDKRTAALSRSLTDLEKELEEAGVALPSNGYGKAELVQLLKSHHWETEHPGEEMPAFVDPMLLRSTTDLPKEEVKRMFEAPEWYVEQKRDGVRAILDFDGAGKPRAYSRSVSVKTYMPSSLTEAIFWLPSVPTLANTTLDGELISVKPDIDTAPYTRGGKGGKTANVLQAVVALTSIQDTRAAQEGNGMPLRYVIYDVVRHEGKDLQKLPYLERREVMEAVLTLVGKHSDKLILNPTTNVDKQKIWDEVIAKGGEGLVFKHKDLPYQPGKRPPGAFKHKVKQELDVVVTGVLPPQSGAHLKEGLVGGLTFSAKDVNTGEWHELGASSALDLQTRREISEQNPDGSFKGVKPGIIGEWVFEVEFRGWTKNYRMVHARPVRRRDAAAGVGADTKSPDQVTFDFAAVKELVDRMEQTAELVGNTGNGANKSGGFTMNTKSAVNNLRNIGEHGVAARIERSVKAARPRREIRPPGNIKAYEEIATKWSSEFSSTSPWDEGIAEGEPDSWTVDVDRDNVLTVSTYHDKLGEMDVLVMIDGKGLVIAADEDFTEGFTEGETITPEQFDSKMKQTFTSFVESARMNWLEGGAAEYLAAHGQTPYPWQAELQARMREIDAREAEREAAEGSTEE